MFKPLNMLKQKVQYFKKSEMGERDSYELEEITNTNTKKLLEVILKSPNLIMKGYDNLLDNYILIQEWREGIFDNV